VGRAGIRTGGHRRVSNWRRLTDSVRSCQPQGSSIDRPPPSVKL